MIIVYSGGRIWYTHLVFSVFTSSVSAFFLMVSIFTKKINITYTEQNLMIPTDPWDVIHRLPFFCKLYSVVHTTDVITKNYETQ